MTHKKKNVQKRKRRKELTKCVHFYSPCFFPPPCHILCCFSFLFPLHTYTHTFIENVLTYSGCAFKSLSFDFVLISKSMAANGASHTFVSITLVFIFDLSPHFIMFHLICSQCRLFITAYDSCISYPHPHYDQLQPGRGQRMNEEVGRVWKVAMGGYRGFFCVKG